MSKIHKILLTFTLSCLIFSGSMGQVKSVYDDMSLNEILNVDVVVTASKKPEDLFEAPLSTTIIDRKDIFRSGATSIMEALRLAPGLIVREVTPGNYDVQIRGFDDMTKNAYVTLPFNSTVLVMINNRIVYSYFSGGTFWETLPIDIHDVERIEIVRGPASALYGANAATGVIHIITSHIEEHGLNAFATGTIGSLNAKIVNANVGYNWNGRTRLNFTTNFTHRSRLDNQYYNWNKSEYTSLENLNLMMSIEKNTDTHELWNYQDYSDSLNTIYDVDVSLQKMGANVFFDHIIDEHSNFNVAFGAQKSQVQKPGFLNFATPLSQNNSVSYYVDGRLKLYNLFCQLNISSGEDLNSNPGNSYKFSNIDANIEYLFQYNKISIRPGINLKNSNYNSPLTYKNPFDFSKLNYQFNDESRIMHTFSTSLLTEWKPSSKLRLIGGLRMDKFDINKHYFANYELAATYRIDKNNLVRAVYSHANRSPFIFDTYLNSKMNLYVPFEFESNEVPVFGHFEQNLLARKDQNYPTNNSIELSWRSQISPKINIDIEVFAQRLNNLLVSNAYREAYSQIQLTPENNVDSIISIAGLADIYFENFDVTARQAGISFMLKINPSEKVELKLFGTAQTTKLFGITDMRFNTTDQKITFDEENNILTTTGYSNVNLTLWSEKLTPTLYGGFYLNYTPNHRLNMNLNAYMYTKQEFAGVSFYNIVSDVTGLFWDNYMTINPYAIINAKVIYKVTDKTKVFVSVKNMLGKHREFGFTDNIGSTYLVGIQWTL